MLQVHQDPEGNRVQAEYVRPVRLQHNHYGIVNEDLFSHGLMQAESLQEEIQQSHDQMALQGLRN